MILLGKQSQNNNIIGAGKEMGVAGNQERREGRLAVAGDTVGSLWSGDSWASRRPRRFHKSTHEIKFHGTIRTP